MYCSPFGRWPSYPHRPLYEARNSNGGVPGEREQRYDIPHVFASGTGGQKFIVYRGVDLVIGIRNGAFSVADGGTVVDQFSGHKTVWNAVRPAMLKFDPIYRDDEAGFCGAYRRSEYAPSLREPWFAETGARPAVAGGAPTKPDQRVAAGARRCSSRRRLTITVRKPRRLRLRRVAVSLDGRPIRVRRGKRITAVVDLRGRGPGIAVVRIRMRGTRGGKTVRTLRTRSFVTCTPTRS
jgi:hypothetical protein